MGRVVKYTLLTYAAIAYGVILGDNWHWYAMALMLYAIRSHYVAETRVPASLGERRATPRDGGVGPGAGAARFAGGDGRPDDAGAPPGDAPW
jgi:hypothetical protein